MSSVEHVEVRSGAYHDSVTLLQVSRAVADVDGVRAAQVAMATPLNVEVLQGMGFAVPERAGAGRPGGGRPGRRRGRGRRPRWPPLVRR